MLRGKNRGSKIEIGNLEFVEKLLIPMQNLSMTLAKIADGRLEISQQNLMAGIVLASSQVEIVTQYLFDLKDGKVEERALRLPGLIKSMVETAIALETQAASEDAASQVNQAENSVVPFAPYPQKHASSAS